MKKIGRITNFIKSSRLLKLFQIINPLSARAFLWAFFLNIEKLKDCNAISQEWINQNAKFCIPFCRKFQALIRKCQIFFINLTVSGVTAVRSDHGVMSYIPDIGTS